MYISGTALLLHLVCISKTTKYFMENIVGSAFLEKFVPNNKRSNLLRLYIPVFALLFLDMVSKEYLVALQLEECNI